MLSVFVKLNDLNKLSCWNERIHENSITIETYQRHIGDPLETDLSVPRPIGDQYVWLETYRHAWSETDNRQAWSETDIPDQRPIGRPKYLNVGLRWVSDQEYSRELKKKNKSV